MRGPRNTNRDFVTASKIKDVTYYSASGHIESLSSPI
jgi:hypothetical protein